MNPATYSLEGKIAVIHMDDGKANALSDAMLDALAAYLERAEREASALVLVGRPDRFCAGFDLRVMMSSPDAAKALLGKGARLFMKLYGFSLPVVIGCTGHALAGGALVLLTGDLRIGAAGPYRIGLNEVSIGLPVPELAMALAKDRLSPTALSRATLLGEIYDPEGAARIGYLDEVTAADEVIARAKSEAEKLSTLSRIAITATKKRLRATSIEHVLTTLESDMAELLGHANA